MSSSPPLRHVREIVGAFVLLTLFGVLAALLVVGRGRHWFDRSVELEATFPAEHAAVLRAGVPVKLAGGVVGRVVESKREQRLVRARLSLNGSARDVLRDDARATLRVPIAGLVGELGIELDAGGGAGIWPDGKVLVGEAEGDPATRARETLDALRTQLPAILGRTQEILTKADLILGQVHDTRAVEHADRLVLSMDRLARAVERERAVEHAAAVLARAEELLRGLRDGKGTAGKLMTDSAMYDRIETALADLHGSWEKIDGLIGHTSNIARHAAELAEAARGRREEVEVLLSQTQLLIIQANRTLELVNEHWLLRGSVPDPGAPSPPAVIDGLPVRARGPGGEGHP
jgi:ABC-type transporter Mla subunit MlaD